MEPQDELISRREVQEMIDDAIRRHNRNASIISMCVGWVVLALFANLSNAEENNSNPIDYLSNGFKIRTSSSSHNASGGTYIYMVFAENPFKYANAR